LFIIVLLGLLLTGVLPSAHAAGGKNLIALGDSYAFGYTSAATTPVGLGDQGYVSLFADFWATHNGGIRPTVTNLAVPGESSTSFFTGAPTLFDGTVPPYPNGLVDAPLRNPSYNTHYTVPGTSQSTLLTQSLATIQAAGDTGDTVDYATIQLGGNDILGPIVQPVFQGLTPLQQSQVISAQFAALQTNYTALLTSLKAAAPQAKIFVIGYADPFAGLGPANPLAGISTPLTLQANALFKGLATSFGAKYVDIYTPFVGHELEYTNITTLDAGIPNYHPNATGYGVIANQLALAAAAPEPCTMILFLTAIPVGVAALLRRRTGAVPIR
jgi:lysophospholipase L1-like esterase